MAITLKGLKTIRTKYQGAIDAMERQLSDKILFEFGIKDVPGDGFCILHVDSANLAPLDNVLEHLRNKNELSFGDFEKLTI